MSELRDLTAALRAINTRVASVEECLLVLVRDSAQAAEWRHQQRNRATVDDEYREGQERAIAQVQIHCGSISGQIAEVTQRLDNQAATRLSDVRELRDRVRTLEETAGVAEPTK